MRGAVATPLRPDPTVALAERLRAACVAVGAPAADPDADGPGASSAMLQTLVARARDAAASGDPAVAWLALVAVGRRLPQLTEVDDFRRRCAAAGVDAGVRWLLEYGDTPGGLPPTARLRLTRKVVVDVDFSARHELNTGIQRVVRRTAPRLLRTADVEFVAWDDREAAPGALTGLEARRVLDWDSHEAGVEPPPGVPAPGETGDPEDTIVVPWQSVYVCAEVPAPAHAGRLAGLAARSGNRVAVVGYDCIPVVSAELLPPAEAVKFTRYLHLVKHAHLVCAISESAAEEFRGYVDMIRVQGLPGPAVEACVLATEVPGVEPVAADRPAASRQVLVVGSHDPRKNHTAVLHAAERLWSEGHDFSLHFVGGRGWRAEEFDRAVQRARRRGWSVQVRRGAPDRELWSQLAGARFSVFVSHHEGFGLPAVESQALGVPVLTSSRGSLAELAARGGMLTVEPDDDDAIADAMRRLLTDDDLVRRLSREGQEAPRVTWDEYADRLWAAVDRERSAAGARA